MNENEYAPEDEGVLAADVSMARKLLYISIHADVGFPDREMKKGDQAVWSRRYPSYAIDT